LRSLPPCQAWVRTAAPPLRTGPHIPLTALHTLMLELRMCPIWVCRWCAGAISGILPMVAMGAYFLFQQRGKKAEEKKELSELERVAEDQGFDSERLAQLAEWVRPQHTRTNPRSALLRSSRQPPALHARPDTHRRWRRCVRAQANKIIKKKQMPGVVLAVARKGKLVYHEAYGDRTFQRDSILSMQSMSSSIIAAALMTLVDEGLVSVEDDVTKYIPSFANFRVYRSVSERESVSLPPPLCGYARRICDVSYRELLFGNVCFHDRAPRPRPSRPTLSGSR
jgi:hypothetical protein